MGVETIAGLAASLIGAGLSASAASSEQNAQNNAVKQELLRQQGFAQQGQKVFANNLAASTPQATQSGIQTGANQAANAVQLARAVPLSLGQSVSIPGQDSYSQATSARTALSDQANAANQGYNQFAVQQALRNLLSNQQLGVIGQASQSSGGILPYEVQQAGQSSAGQAGLGSLLSSLGGVLGLGAASGGNLFGAVRRPASGLLGDFNFNPSAASTSLA